MSAPIRPSLSVQDWLEKIFEDESGVIGDREISLLAKETDKQTLNKIASFLVSTFGEFYDFQTSTYISSDALKQKIDNQKKLGKLVLSHLEKGSFSHFVISTLAKQSIAVPIMSPEVLSLKLLSHMQSHPHPVQALYACKYERNSGTLPKQIEQITSGLKEEHQARVEHLFAILDQEQSSLCLNQEDKEKLQQFLCSKSAIIEKTIKGDFKVVNWMTLLERWRAGASLRDRAFKIDSFVNHFHRLSVKHLSAEPLLDVIPKARQRRGHSTLLPSSYNELYYHPSKLLSCQETLIEDSLALVFLKFPFSKECAPPSALKNIKNEWMTNDSLRMHMVSLCTVYQESEHASSFFENDRLFTRSFSGKFLNACIQLCPLTKKDPGQDPEMLEALFEWILSCPQEDLRLDLSDFDEENSKIFSNAFQETLDLIEKFKILNPHAFQIFCSVYLVLKNEDKDASLVFKQAIAILNLFLVRKIDNDQALLFHIFAQGTSSKTTFSFLQIYLAIYLEIIGRLEDDLKPLEGTFCKNLFHTLKMHYTEESAGASSSRDLCEETRAYIFLFQTHFRKMSPGTFLDYFFDFLNGRNPFNSLSFLQGYFDHIKAIIRKLEQEEVCLPLESSPFLPLEILERPLMLCMPQEGLEEQARERLDTLAASLKALQGTYPLSALQALSIVIRYSSFDTAIFSQQLDRLKEFEEFINHPLNPRSFFTWMFYCPKAEESEQFLRKFEEIQAAFIKDQKDPQNLETLKSAIGSFCHIKPLDPLDCETLDVYKPEIIEIGKLITYSITSTSFQLISDFLKPKVFKQQETTNLKKLQLINKNYPLGKAIYRYWSIPDDENKCPVFIMNFVNFSTLQTIEFKVPLTIPMRKIHPNVDTIFDLLYTVSTNEDLCLNYKDSSSSGDLGIHGLEDSAEKISTFVHLLKTCLQFSLNFLATSPKHEEALFEERHQRIGEESASNFAYYFANLEPKIRAHREVYDALVLKITDYLKKGDFKEPLILEIASPKSAQSEEIFIHFSQEESNDLIIGKPGGEVLAIKYAHLLGEAAFSTFLKWHICKAMQWDV